jgi:hypothetical protein
MTTIDDKAEAVDSPDVHLVRDSAPGLYRLETIDLTPADELGNDEFPRYGDFVECTDSRMETCYVEVPGALAKFLANYIEVGDWFRIVSVSKTADGEWRYDVDEEPDNLPPEAE